MAVKLGNGNWAVKEDKLLAYNDNSGKFFNKEFDFARGSIATYVGKDGLIKSAASDVPRIDFSDSTNGALLLEPQSTNLLTYSEDFSQSAWGFFNGTIVVSNQITSPDGSSLADRIECGINGNLTPIFDYINITNGEYYTFSVFAKKGEIDKFSISGQEDLLANASFNLTTGNIISTNGSGYVNSTIEEFSNGWYRCSVTALASGTRSGRFILYAGISGDVPDLGDGIYYFAAQQEQGSYATSYIPSLSGSATTRLADVCNNSGSAQDFNSEGGVLYAEIAALANDLTRRIITITDSTLNSIVKLEYKNTSNQIEAVLYNGNTECLILHTLSDETEFNKIAFKYKQDDFSLFVNGIKVGTDTSGAVFTPNTLNNLSFYQGNSNNLYGKVKDLQVFTEALTDEQLAALTTI